MIFRVNCAARVCFDVEATSPEEATARAAEVLGRLDDGVDVDNVDPEEGLVAAVMYPAEREGGPLVEVVDVREGEEAA